MTPAECAAWDRDNPRVWTRFVRHAWARWHDLERRGIEPDHRRFSARVIIGKMRWDEAMKTERQADAMAWKINDHLAPYFARKFRDMYPKLDGFFQIREKAEPRGHWAGLRDGPQRQLFGG